MSLEEGLIYLELKKCFILNVDNLMIEWIKLKE